MFNQRFKHRTSSMILLVCVLGIIILLNFISVKMFFRVDFTEDKVYTLSEASKKLMQELDDPLIIKAYFTRNLPPPYNNHTRFVKDKLDEFKAYSRGNLRYEFIDPAEHKGMERELMMLGIPSVQLTEIKMDKFEIKKGYMGLAIMFEDRNEVIPVIESTVGLEYDITSKIKKVIKKDVKTIGFLTGHGEPDIEQDIGTVTSLLRQQYEVTTVTTKDGGTIPDSVDALVVVGPTEELTERERYEIDQFVMQGRPIAFLIDRFKVDLQRFMATPVKNNLEDMLEHYGVKVNDDLILDLDNRRIQVQQRRGFMFISNIIDYPYIPIARDMDNENVIVSKLEGVFFPFVSSLDLKEEGNDGETTVAALIKSSDKSWRQSGSFYNLNPLQRFMPDLSNRGPFAVAAVLSGKFKSFYADKEIPRVESTGIEGEKIFIETSPETRILVIGDSDFLKDSMFMDRTNLSFAMNMMDWLVQDEALIAIRSRGVTDRPLAQVPDFTRQMIKYLNIFGVSVVVALFGLIRWRIRQMRKKEVWT